MSTDATKDSGSSDGNQEEQDVAGKENLTDHPKKVDLPPRLFASLQTNASVAILYFSNDSFLLHRSHILCEALYSILLMVHILSKSIEPQLLNQVSFKLNQNLYTA